MSSEIPKISRENEAHAKEALADQIRLETITSTQLFNEKLWRNRPAMTVLPRKNGDKIGWHSDHPLRLRANPGKTEEVNAIKEDAIIKITGRPAHTADADGEHWWYPVEVGSGDLKNPSAANTGWVSAEFILAALPRPEPMIIVVPHVPPAPPESETISTPPETTVDTDTSIRGVPPITITGDRPGMRGTTPQAPGGFAGHRGTAPSGGPTVNPGSRPAPLTINVLQPTPLTPIPLNVVQPTPTGTLNISVPPATPVDSLILKTLQPTPNSPLNISVPPATSVNGLRLSVPGVTPNSPLNMSVPEASPIDRLTLGVPAPTPADSLTLKTLRPTPNSPLNIDVAGATPNSGFDVNVTNPTGVNSLNPHVILPSPNDINFNTPAPSPSDTIQLNTAPPSGNSPNPNVVSPTNSTIDISSIPTPSGNGDTFSVVPPSPPDNVDIKGPEEKEKETMNKVKGKLIDVLGIELITKLLETENNRGGKNDEKDLWTLIHESRHVDKDDLATTRFLITTFPNQGNGINAKNAYESLYDEYQRVRNTTSVENFTKKYSTATNSMNEEGERVTLESGLQKLKNWKYDGFDTMINVNITPANRDNIVNMITKADSIDSNDNKHKSKMVLQREPKFGGPIRLDEVSFTQGGTHIKGVDLTNHEKEEKIYSITTGTGLNITIVSDDGKTTTYKFE